MNRHRNFERPLPPGDEARRRFLLRGLALGLFAGGTGWNLPALASIFGKLPGRLPEGKSIFELKGEVLVNGKRATEGTLIRPTDSVVTAASSHVIYAVGNNAYILRENSTLELRQVGKALRQTLRLVTGKLLGVFGRRSAEQRLNLSTANATIGIRGTGVYAETDPEKTYLCTCYGTTEMFAAPDYDMDAGTASKKSAPPPENISVTTQHHEAAKYILSSPENGKRIIPAPFINHTDLELMTLEALVGREVPFGLPAEQYERPRRDY